VVCLKEVRLLASEPRALWLPRVRTATMFADSSTSALLAGSRSLRSLIQDTTDLPPVSRSIHQIAEQSERMLAAASAGTPSVPPASTFRFLAAQGIDSMELDPSVIELTRAPGEAGSARPGGVYDDTADLETFLGDEQRQILHEAVLEANQLVIDEFDTSFWTQDRAHWEVCA
jgi:hypothetical protein